MSAARALRLVVLQPTSLCNLDCSYCYVPGRRDPARMSDAVLEAALRAVFESSYVGESIEILWHAGEPLAAGIAHFERALELIERFRGAVEVRKSVQTNGVLVDRQWAELFARHAFSVGVSIDGPRDLHDANRKSWSGSGSHDAVMRGVHTLREANVDPGALCVLTRASLSRAADLFSFFADNGFTWLGLNVDEVENARRQSSLAGVETEAEYRSFMRELFRLWAASDRRLRIREIADVATIVRDKQKDDCFYRCPDETREVGILTVQKNGDVSIFSPELAGLHSEEFDDFVVGNVLRDSLDDIYRGSRTARLLAAVNEGVRACASSCSWFDFCGGGYVSNKYTEHATFAATETTACRLHRQALADVLLMEMARLTAPPSTPECV